MLCSYAHTDSLLVCKNMDYPHQIYLFLHLLHEPSKLTADRIFVYYWYPAQRVITCQIL